MRFAVTGGRTYHDAEAIEHMLLKLSITDTMVHGDAHGADEACAEWWKMMGGKTEAHPADWRGPCGPECRPGHRRPNPPGAQIMPADWCPAAGVRRNQEMLESGIDFLVAFPGGRGTADMVARCRKAGLHIHHGGIS
jgi:hypothetical protein